MNYFQKPRGLVPNNTCEWIWVLGVLARATGEARYLESVPELLAFLEAVQMPSGELPYELAGGNEPRTRPHYLCYQYNAFQCMKLAWYASDARRRARARRSPSGSPTTSRPGVLPSGAVRASCASVHPGGGLLRRRRGDGAPHRERAGLARSRARSPTARSAG